jgi:hypothetical protein
LKFFGRQSFSRFNHYITELLHNKGSSCAEDAIMGPIFRTFFSTENHFPRKIPRNFLDKWFFEIFFCGKFNFSQHFLGGKFSAEFSPEKNVRKIGPRPFSGQRRRCIEICGTKMFCPLTISLYLGFKFGERLRWPLLVSWQWMIDFFRC